MKISNSKKQLARIISDNGGWPRNADWAAQCKSDSTVSFYYGMAPYIEKGDDAWYGDYLGAEHDIDVGKVLPNWHQTILSRDEYFHLYPAPDAGGWIEWNGGECPVAEGPPISIRHRDGEEFVDAFALGCWNSRWEHQGMVGDVVAYRLRTAEPEKSIAAGDVDTDLAGKEVPVSVAEAKPTIEQLAAEYRNRLDYAERKQQEADEAKAEAEAKLAELVAAGKALGLVLSVAAPEPELVITESGDLLEGDVIELTAGERYFKTECTMVHIPGVGLRAKSADDTEEQWWNLDGHQESKWRFIRRPVKGGTNA